LRETHLTLRGGGGWAGIVAAEIYDGLRHLLLSDVLRLSFAGLRRAHRKTESHRESANLASHIKL
jgi:hypothetical protein